MCVVLKENNIFIRILSEDSIVQRGKSTRPGPLVMIQQTEERSSSPTRPGPGSGPGSGHGTATDTRYGPTFGQVPPLYYTATALTPPAQLKT